MTSKTQNEFSARTGRRSMARSTSSRTIFGTVMTVLIFTCAAIALLPLIAVLTYVTIKGFSRLDASAFTQLPPPPMVPGGGFGSAIVGTLIMVGIGALISIPIGVLAAIYLTEFSNRQTADWIRFAANVLSGVPSIIAGVFAYGIIVVTMGKFSAIAGGFALSILMLPIIVRTTDESLQLVSRDLRQAAVGIGATKFQTVTQVVLPVAVPAIVTGITLAIARAAGETAPLLFTALFAQFWVTDLTSPTPSLAVLIYNFAIVPFENQRELAWAASLVLVFLVLITSIIARWVTRKRM